MIYQETERNALEYALRQMYESEKEIFDEDADTRFLVHRLYYHLQKFIELDPSYEGYEIASESNRDTKEQDKVPDRAVCSFLDSHKSVVSIISIYPSITVKKDGDNQHNLFLILANKSKHNKFVTTRDSDIEKLRLYQQKYNYDHVAYVTFMVGLDYSNDLNQMISDSYEFIE